MSFIAEINLSPVTLLLVFVAPFAYYGYHAKFWYLAERLSFLDFILQVITVFGSFLLVIRAYYALVDHEYEQVQLSIAHICPLALTLLAIARGKGLGREGHEPRSKQAIPTGEQKSEFNPKARNSEIEGIAWDDLIIDAGTKSELVSVINLLKDPKTAKDYGISLPKGILFNGPPGTGKTSVAKAVAHMAGLNFFVLRANEIVSKWVGESEKNLTKLFENAAASSPAVIFIDEIDSLGKKRSESNASHGDNLLNHLLQLMDGVLKLDGVYIIGATNRADLVDDALRRAGRLSRVIEIPLPDLDSRKKLFSVYGKSLQLAQDVDVELLAKVTAGNSGADIKAICDQAGLHAYQREQSLPTELRKHLVSNTDFEHALEMFSIDESLLEEENANSKNKSELLQGKIESIGWDEIVIDDGLKQELKSVIALLREPSLAEKYGITTPKGLLLNGPPGTGKTTLAKVIANEAKLSFFALQLNDIVSKWVGESEKNLTALFKTAAKNAPSVIFIDEVDAIGKNRAEGNAQHADSLLNHLLQLIDGIVKQEGVFIIAATNRADLVDPALKRAGRLNKVVEVSLPSKAARVQLFALYLKKLPLAKVVDIEALADATVGKCAADIREICNQAGLNAFKRESGRGNRDYTVALVDLDKALVEWTGGKGLGEL